MQFHNPAIESPDTGSRRILTGLLDGIGEHLTAPSAISDSNIHEMRKTCKKLRALLRMIRPALDADSFRILNRSIRDFARQLATLRDKKVMLDTLEQLDRHFAPVLHEQALAAVHEALRHSPAKHAGAAAVALDPATLQRQLAEILAVAGQTDFGRIDSRIMLAGIADCYRRARRALARMEASPDTDNGHALRRQAKYQYYQLCMLDAWNGAELKTAISDFHRLEDTLGKDHDLAVLEETLATHPDLCPDRVRRELLHALIESRRIALMSKAMRIARALYHLRPGKYRRRLESTLAPAADL
ncbi:MAG TPA: CHAD domain-containing protein [Gammaproteobacteria bacterium]|nr:CHAD domain-containing protein [Gammaproteobacteria bacterium]